MLKNRPPNKPGGPVMVGGGGGMSPLQMMMMQENAQAQQKPPPQAAPRVRVGQPMPSPASRISGPAPGVMAPPPGGGGMEGQFPGERQMNPMEPPPIPHNKAFSLMNYNDVITGMAAAVTLTLFYSQEATSFLNFGIVTVFDFIIGLVMRWRFWAPGSGSNTTDQVESVRRQVLEQREPRAHAASCIFILLCGVTVVFAGLADLNKGPVVLVTSQELRFYCGIVFLPLFLCLALQKWRYGKMFNSEALKKSSNISMGVAVLAFEMLLYATFLNRADPTLWVIGPAINNMVGVKFFVQGSITIVKMLRAGQKIFQPQWWWYKPNEYHKKRSETIRRQSMARLDKKVKRRQSNFSDNKLQTVEEDESFYSDMEKGFENNEAASLSSNNKDISARGPPTTMNRASSVRAFPPGLPSSSYRPSTQTYETNNAYRKVGSAFEIEESFKPENPLQNNYHHNDLDEHSIAASSISTHNDLKASMPKKIVANNPYEDYNDPGHGFMSIPESIEREFSSSQKEEIPLEISFHEHFDNDVTTGDHLHQLTVEEANDQDEMMADTAGDESSSGSRKSL